jgi:type II secretory ATPase GspE/PulE/Tfp pilus assembly ATPase PilB-like protein
MRTLYMDGLNKAVKGDTTLQEVLRVTQKDYIEG